MGILKKREATPDAPEPESVRVTRNYLSCAEELSGHYPFPEVFESPLLESAAQRDAFEKQKSLDAERIKRVLSRSSGAVGVNEFHYAADVFTEVLKLIVLEG